MVVPVSLLLVLICAGTALFHAYKASKGVLAAGTGTEEMQRIASAIQEGAQAYLSRQYRTIAIVGAVVAVLLLFALSFKVALGFVIGACLSGAAGFIGMNVSVRANVRTAEAARGGMVPALNIAFQSGAITGLLVVGLGLLGVSLYYIILSICGVSLTELMQALVALSFGASLISIFARLGGGIFTKGADVGAEVGALLSGTVALLVASGAVVLPGLGVFVGLGVLVGLGVGVGVGVGVGSMSGFALGEYSSSSVK